MMVLFLKPKNPVEQAEKEAAKTQVMQMKIKQENLKGSLASARERRRNAELRRLRA
jgi:hypothetical protein